MGEEATTILMGASEIEEIQDTIDQRFISFKNFDVAYYPPSDHRFVNNPTIERQFLCGSRRSKTEDDRDSRLKNRIEQERDVLRQSLPNSMFVRAYDGKIQLMRALVVGLEGTPYANFLFFFDVFFPRDYPTKPPLIFQHHNHNLLDLNSNSISAYNHGEGLEGGTRFEWDPNTSNLYHVLEFIQGYVLRTSNNNLLYAEDAEKDFLLSHIAMLGILRSPPREFEDFVKGHFRKSSHSILMKFRSEGELGESEVKTELFFELLEAFEANGSYCKHLAYGINKRVKSSLLLLKLSAIKGSSSPKNNPILTRLKSSNRPRSIALCIGCALIIGGAILVAKFVRFS